MIDNYKLLQGKQSPMLGITLPDTLPNMYQEVLSVFSCMSEQTNQPTVTHKFYQLHQEVLLF